MIPPRRSKDGMAGTANSRECLITKTYNQYLKAVRGWRHFNCGLDDWTFIPPSLLPTDPKQVKTVKASILKNGIHGVHYASGWMGLADMIDVYGRDYAPSLQDAIAQGIVPPTAVATAVTPSAAPSNRQSSLRANRVSLSPAAQQESDDDDEETVAFPQEQTSTIERRGEEREQDQSVTASTNEDDSTNHESGDDDDDDDDDDSQEANNRKIADLMTCIEKCNSQITWINDNPNEQSLQEAQEQKQDLRNTKRTAHEQLRALTSNNQEYVFL